MSVGIEALFTVSDLFNLQGGLVSAKRLNPVCASRTSGDITNNKLGIKVQWARHLRKIVRSLSLPPVPRRIPLARLPLTALLALPQR